MSAEEEKTRLLHGRPAIGPPPGSDAGEAGDKIVFRCPNGHRIAANAALAGKRGRCTKCQVDVIIPGQASRRPSGGTDWGAIVLPEEPQGPFEAGDSPAAESRPLVQESRPEPRVSSPPPLPIPPGGAATADAPAMTAGAEPSIGGQATWDLGALPPEQPGVFPPTWSAPGMPAGLGGGAANPTAQLVARLWAEREHGGIIELHLEGGSVILPEWYDANWSRGTHGLFASQAADGTVTLTAVAWETVRKVVVRQLTEVPDDMFT